MKEGFIFQWREAGQGDIIIGMHYSIFLWNKDVMFDKHEDYAKYEPVVIKCFEYLGTTSLNDHEKRIEANKLFMIWLDGSPNVTVDVLPYLLDLIRINKDFLMTYRVVGQSMS